MSSGRPLPRWRSPILCQAGDVLSFVQLSSGARMWTQGCLKPVCHTGHDTGALGSSSGEAMHLRRPCAGGLSMCSVTPRQASPSRGRPFGRRWFRAIKGSWRPSTLEAGRSLDDSGWGVLGKLLRTWGSRPATTPFFLQAKSSLLGQNQKIPPPGSLKSPWGQG